MSAESMRIAERVRLYNRGRRPDTLAIKYARLRASAYAFYRGTGHLLCEAWPPDEWLDEAPPALICGDLHLENFGVYLGDDGLAAFDVNDFDEAVLAPVSWDLVRFIASLFVGLAAIGRSEAAAQRLSQHFVETYAAALAQGGAPPEDAAVTEGPIGQMRREFPRSPALGYRDALARLTVHGRQLRMHHARLLPVGSDERQRIAKMVERVSRERVGAGACRVLDVARLVAGTSSLGLDRYAVLLDGDEQWLTGRLLDVKEARPSCLRPYVKERQPHWPDEAARVTTMQRKCQAVPPSLLWAAGDGHKSFIIRRLARDQERVNLEDAGWTQRRLALAVASMGQVVANGHLRGASDAQALQTFAREATGRKGLIRYAREYAARNQADYRAYCAAYDRGVLGGGE